MVFGSDGSFSPEQFVERINSDLANAFGNLLNRTVSMINKYFDGVIPEYKGDVTPFDGALRTAAESTVRLYESNLDDLKITEAIAAVNDLVSRANKYIDETTPWVLAKEGKTEELASVMNHLANAIFIAAKLYEPVLVKASPKAFDQLGLDENNRGYDKVYNFGSIGGTHVVKGEQLFPRLDAAVEVEFIQELMGMKKE